MSKHNTMTYKETVEELEFAIEHNWGKATPSECISLVNYFKD